MIFKHWTVTSGARRDARAGLDSAEDRIIGELGPRPEPDAARNPEYGRAVATLAERHRIDEANEDLTRAEDTRDDHTAPLFYNIGIGLMVLFEWFGAMQIASTLVQSPTARVPVSLMLSVAIIGSTAAVAHRNLPKSGSPLRPSDGISNTVNVVKRSVWSLVLYVAYAIFIGAITVVRLYGAADEDTSQVEALGNAAIMVVMSLGPAWCTEWLIRHRAPSRAASRLVRSLRRRLRKAERDQLKAQTTVDRIARAAAEWDAEAARRRALYRTEHKLETAKAPR
ncbi:MAG: hypothetical protein IT376_23600 [Polyangiaceae bacterium]|nr:hypothetical protein [Polyangiaceae bacterium]